MSGIKFNYLTNGIEMKGSESFIESNFNKIQDLLIETFGVKKKMTSRSTEKNREPLLGVMLKETQAKVEAAATSNASQISQATAFPIHEIRHELTAKRPPLRKYIRKEGTPGHQRTVVEVAELKPQEISISSLKKKFGLSDSKIGGIIRDAEKLGKIRRAVDGSYVWI
jgi:hypothetical protein